MRAGSLQDTSIGLKRGGSRVEQGQRAGASRNKARAGSDDVDANEHILPKSSTYLQKWVIKTVHVNTQDVLSVTIFDLLYKYNIFLSSYRPPPWPPFAS